MVIILKWWRKARLECFVLVDFWRLGCLGELEGGGEWKKGQEGGRFEFHGLG